jgi:hypothetical protein
MTQLRWWLVFVLYSVVVLAVVYVLGGLLSGTSYWIVTGIVALAGVAGGAYLQRLRVLAWMDRSEIARSSED